MTRCILYTKRNSITFKIFT